MVILTNFTINTDKSYTNIQNCKCETEQTDIIIYNKYQKFSKKYFCLFSVLGAAYVLQKIPAVNYSDRLIIVFTTKTAMISCYTHPVNIQIGLSGLKTVKRPP